MPKKINRRSLMRGAAGLAAASALPMPAIAQASPIKLGFLASLAGVYAPYSGPMLLGTQIAVDQINKAGGIDGHPIELTVADDAGNATQGVARAREMFGNDIRLIVGLTSSAVSLGVGPLLVENNAVAVACAANSDALTHENFTPNFFRCAANAYMYYQAMGQLAAERNPKDITWAALYPDSAYGRSAIAELYSALRKYYKAKGITPKLLEPVVDAFGATDYKNWIAQLLASDATGLVSLNSGTDAVTLWTQARGFKLGDKFNIILDAGSDVLLAKALGHNQPPNFWTPTTWYRTAFDNPIAHTLYDEVVARTGDREPAGGLIASTHAATHAYALAIRAAGSTDAKKVVSALEGLSWDTAMGRITYRKEDHQADTPVVFLRFGPQSAEPGWQLSETLVIPGASVLGAATPGKAVVLED
jgi:branched-chain amino acid transport system substrate-binding protein